MDKPHKYGADDHMSDLICDNYSLLMVMSRFGLALGFGDKTVREVCQAQGVDYRTFLAVANFISEDQYTYSEDDTDFSLTSLMDYLKRAHTYFLDFNLPAIRRKLIEALDYAGGADLSYLIMRFYDEYAKEVRRHMEYENEAVFTYVQGLMQGRLDEHYDIATFASKHNQIDAKLKELIQKKDFGRYAMADGTMPVCFLTTNDITGGNSGSPVIDGEGNLIGCAFDGNWESLSGDINFDNNLQRCIALDIRYMLFILDKLGGCKHLIDEMTIIE